MRRITISVEDELADAFDKLITVRDYVNRSEAFRDLVRSALDEATIEDQAYAHSHCVASLSYIYNHHERQLANRVNQIQHAHHHVVIATQHVHLDHDHCMETVILQGNMSEVKICANAISSQTGIAHAKIHIIPQ